jgi:hypothetical protein
VLEPELPRHRHSEGGHAAAETYIDAQSSGAGLEQRAMPPDLERAGTIGEHLDEIVGRLSDVREVYVVPETKAHYRKRHGEDFDVDEGERLVSEVLADPTMVARSRDKKNTIIFIGDYDATRALLIPVKTLRGELWLESLYVRKWEKVNRRKWQKGELLFVKK